MGARPVHSLLRRALRRARGRTPSQPTAEQRYDAVAQVARSGVRPLRTEPVSADGPLDVAVLIPWYPPGSGGHATIFNIVRQLERRGHRCSIWLDDPEGRHADLGDAAVARELRALFGGCSGPVHAGFERWSGTDVVLATSWPTAYRALLLDGCRGRAYLVQDHEPEFHPTSAESEWAAATYRAGFHCIAASSWLAELLRDRYGAAATQFELGIDHAVYGPAELRRSDRRVLFYARASTDRRAVPLGLLALAELHRRRPDVEIVLFGASGSAAASFPHRSAGMLPPRDLARAYAEATVGIVLSLTNPSLVPQEMLACGLPCVDVDRPATRAEWEPSGGVELAAFDPAALAGAVERLLDDRALRERRTAAGLAWAAGRTWERAATQVEAGLRAALRPA